MQSCPTTYDVIVLGTGGVGSAACWQLAKRGAKVLGLDRFPAGHDRGSSHGQTRIIRQAYFEHADYVPLLFRAYELWAELEQTSGHKLFEQVGLLQIGPADGVVLPGVLRAAKQHGLDVDLLSANESNRRFPGFFVPANMQAVYERAAGLLHVEACVQAHCAAAVNCGAELRSGVNVRGWSGEDQGVIVKTDQGDFQAEKLVITAGPWAADLLGQEVVPIQVRRKHIYWFPTPSAHHQATRGAPTFLYELPHGGSAGASPSLPRGVFYGFPVINADGLKCGEHSGGELVPDPLDDPRLPNTADEAAVSQFVRSFLPGVIPVPQQRSVCFYSMSPDENLLLDRHPQHANVCFAAGLSGHGFKFTGVLGQILADWTLTGQTNLPVDFLALNRLAQRQQPPAAT